MSSEGKEKLATEASLPLWMTVSYQPDSFLLNDPTKDYVFDQYYVYNCGPMCQIWVYCWT